MPPDRGGAIRQRAYSRPTQQIRWQHINLTGDYLWAADASLGPDGFRPLRGGASTLAEAA